MADYIVKFGGTAAGDAGRYASEQTGSFATLGAANYYNTIATALAATTAPVSGDRVLVSSAHSFDSGSSAVSYSLTLGVTIEITCVDDANMENYRTAEGTRGEEFTSSGSSADVVFAGNFVIRGLRFSSVDNISPSGSGVGMIAYDCEFEYRDNFATAADGQYVYVYNSSMLGVDNASICVVANGSAMFFKDSEFTNTAGSPAALSSAGFANGGGSMTLINNDLSVFSTTLISGVGSSRLGDDSIYILIDRCKLADGVVINNEELASPDQSITMVRSAFASADTEYQYYYTALGSTVQDDSTIRRADGQAFEDSATQIGYRVQTGADVSVANPFTFEFPINTWSELTGSLDTLRFYVASVAAKDNLQVYFDVSYPDATNKNEMKTSSSANTASWGSVDTMAAGVTLTTDSGSDWRDGAGAFTGNEYLVDVTTTTGLDCYPTVTVTVTEASADFYIGSQFDLL